MNTASAMTPMKCEDFADREDFSEMCDEMYWEDNFDADRFLDALVFRASEQRVRLTDIFEWDYDKYFWNMYRCTEKGLS